MISIPSIDGFSFTKEQTYQDFADTLPPAGWAIHDLGVCSDGINNVYGISLGDIYSKPVIYIEGTIHGGHEWRCGHWLKRFAEILSDPSGLPQAELIYKIRSRFSFYIIPCLNPYGYENSDYLNANGVNLNRNFDAYWEQFNGPEGTTQYKGISPFSEPETQIVRDVVLQYKPTMFVDVHTWGGFTGSALEIELSSHHYGIHLVDATETMQLSLDRNDLGYKYYQSKAPRSAEWAGQQVSKSGGSIMGMTFEPGSLETEYEQARIGINATLILCWYLYVWHEKRVFRLF